jgi:penicillin-binding protein 1A
MAQKNKPVVKDIKYYQKKFWRIIIYGFSAFFLFFLFASWGLFGAMPSFEDLENPSSNLATEIISSDGVTLGKFYNENRTSIKFNDLPKHLVDALVSTEDERFYEHSGIDAKRTFGAAIKLGSDGGASTITQQLAKLLFHGEGSKNIVLRVIQKAKEWIIAVRLERQYTKDEIIAMYFNKADFVNTAVGIRSAAKVYFNKEPRDLKIEESAMLVGMLTNPSLFNPVKRVEKTFHRRNIVLGQLVRNGFLEESAKQILEKKPIKLDFHPESHLDGTATYFREYLRDYMKEWAKENKTPDGEDYDVYSDGLKIYTTIDSKIQKYAEEAVLAHIKNLQQEFFIQQRGNKNAPFVNITTAETKKIFDKAMKNSERWRVLKTLDKSDEDIIKSFGVKTKMRIFTWNGEKDTVMTPTDSIRYFKHFLQSGLMSMEPQTGQIKAWVGGINYKFFQYDHVGQGARQVGSTFKPFVYATAIEQLGYSPCDTMVDSPFMIRKGHHHLLANWEPHNSDNRYRGMITLRKALANSVNIISAKLIDKTGPEAVVELAHKLGITSEIPVQPSISLGAVDVTVQEMVGAYSTFANEGVYIKPQFISKIEDKNGAVIYEPALESHDVLNRDIAFVVIKLLEGVTEGGSGERLRTTGGGSGYNRVTGYPYAFENPIAGKTGTTQNQSDGWFIGMVPNLVTGVWVGCEDRSARFKSITYGQGATAALPIWGYFMKKCYQDKSLLISKEEFEEPKNLSIKLDCFGDSKYSLKRKSKEKEETNPDQDINQFQ